MLAGGKAGFGLEPREKKLSGGGTFPGRSIEGGQEGQSRFPKLVLTGVVAAGTQQPAPSSQQLETSSQQREASSQQLPGSSSTPLIMVTGSFRFKRKSLLK